MKVTTKIKVEVTIASDRLRVYLNDLLHLSISVADLVAIQAWKYGTYRFSIEYTLKTTSVETWYVTREIWEEVLRGLAKINLI